MKIKSTMKAKTLAGPVAVPAREAGQKKATELLIKKGLIECDGVIRPAVIMCKRVIEGEAAIHEMEPRDESDPENIEPAYFWCSNCSKEHLAITCEHCALRISNASAIAHSDYVKQLSKMFTRGEHLMGTIDFALRNALIDSPTMRESRIGVIMGGLMGLMKSVPTPEMVSATTVPAEKEEWLLVIFTEPPKFLGAVFVFAAKPFGANVAWKLNINPGGQAATWSVPDNDLPAEALRNRLLTRDELERLPSVLGSFAKAVKIALSHTKDNCVYTGTGKSARGKGAATGA